MIVFLNINSCNNIIIIIIIIIKDTVKRATCFATLQLYELKICTCCVSYRPKAYLFCSK